MWQDDENVLESHAHQVISGALNNGENVFAVGSVEGINFTACAVGCDVVILASNFERVQIIAGSVTSNVHVSCVDCCIDTGKIAIAYGDAVRIFEPTHLVEHSKTHRLDYQWFETNCLHCDSSVSHLSWNLEGLRLLVSSDSTLQLWQHPVLTEFYSGDDDMEEEQPINSIAALCKQHSDPKHHWACVWSYKLSSPIRFLKFSPDGTLFATSGANDRFVKIWYQDRADWENSTELSFNFVYLAHPLAVTGFEWRKTGRYMPRRYISNVIVSWCRDHICRLWCETGGAENELDILTGELNSSHFMVPSNKKQKNTKLKGARQKITHRLKHLKKLKHKKMTQYKTNSETSIHEVASAPGFIEQCYHPPPTLHFHLTASVNPATDCFLVPSLENTSTELNFNVHFLNNKELVFSLGAEHLLAEALLADSNPPHPPLSEGVNGNLPSENGPMFFRHDSSVETCSELNAPADSTQTNPSNTEPLSPSLLSAASTDSFHKDVMDLRLEALLREWTHSSDILFTVHPMDGSLLVWTVDYLDEPTRQPSISFSSRIPGAFPLTDAASLHQGLVTFNPHDPVFVHSLHPNALEICPMQSRLSTSIFLLTNHDNGSLNLWQLSMDEKSKFMTILNVAHRSRMCGHRFRINRVVCHPVLPLFLTTSHHNIRSKMVVKKLSPSSSTEHDYGDIQLFPSELILWKVTAVGPLCRSGGVRELARINSPELAAFSNLAWIPAVLPSSTLGSVCNSPSSCFVASDGKCLRVYQAVLDARALLAEMNFGKPLRADSVVSSRSSSTENTPEHRPVFFPVFGGNLRDTFNVVSSQSSARPGCVLQLAPISDADQEWRSIQLLHVFQDQMINPHNHTTPVIDHFKSAVFQERFYVVLLEKNKVQTAEAPAIVHMWLLEIASQPPAPYKRHQIDNALDMSPDDHPHFYPTATATAPSAAQLYIRSKKVCTQSLQLPPDVFVVDACPSGGHLASASLYPAYNASYQLITACSDDILRFWTCHMQPDGRYKWEEWKMLSKNRESSVELDGRPLGVTCAHSNRLAVAVDESPEGQRQDEYVSVQIAIFECESTGGTEWAHEDTIQIKNVKIPTTSTNMAKYDFTQVKSPVNIILDGVNPIQRKNSSTALQRIPSFPRVSSDMRRVVSDQSLRKESEAVTQVVRIDWVSTEDGGHILTVGVGPKIFLYAPVSQDVAQTNILMMKEEQTQTRRPLLRQASSLARSANKNKLIQWVNLRTVELHSADGLPPLPMMLSWVRDGILVVGMQSEMRVYSQWNFKTSHARSVPSTPLSPEAAGPQLHLSIPSTFQLRMSPSHSALDLKAITAAKKPRREFSKPPVPVIPENEHANEIVEIVAEEGLFEAARLANPLLPQYHPRQLMELLNAGKTRRVKAILLHVLRCMVERNLQPVNARRASVYSTDDQLRPRSMSTVNSNMLSENMTLDYEEIDSIPPLPLHALLAADSDVLPSETDSGLSGDSQKQYDGLFHAEPESADDSGLDDMLDEENEGGRKRRNSRSLGVGDLGPSAIFTAKHCRMLTNFLTHLHLPGLSSVDQMHLLAVADTLSSFSPDVMDKLTQANAALKKVSNVIGDSLGAGYASAGSGADSVDDCGLRYLMAMRQHDYLLLCLPIKQRHALRTQGLQSSTIIWALHSETETELLNSVPSLQRGDPTWGHLRTLGVGWWLKNTAALRLCIEKIAKAAFQSKQDPMDAAMFYLAMRKKNVLTHLFKSNHDSRMSEFFGNNFEEDRWKKAAMKNAFVLMGKQRFEHAVGFFLLGGALQDAIQTCLTKLKDLQLAFVIVRLYETDADRQQILMRQLLCMEVLGCTPEELDSKGSSVEPGGSLDLGDVLSVDASPDPFIRSMAYWHLKEYARAASTMLEEVSKSDVDASQLSDMFNFYSYLRTHPLVVRQRLIAHGHNLGQTEKFMTVAKLLANKVTPAERRLYFRSAATHFKMGCPLLALEVLSQLPNRLSLVIPGSSTASSLLKSPKKTVEFEEKPAEVKPLFSVSSTKDDENEDLDWGTSLMGNGMGAGNEDLQLKWSDSEGSEDEDGIVIGAKTPVIDNKQSEAAVTAVKSASLEEVEEEEGPIDVVAQQMKFMACLKLLMDELATLASGFEVEGGQLRFQLYSWLEKEVEVLKKVCDYHSYEAYYHENADDDLEHTEQEHDSPSLSLHDALRHDRADMTAKWDQANRRRKWLAAHQQLLRTLASYCALHGSQGVGLASARMELLLLLLELHQEPVGRQLSAPIPFTGVFPLLSASVTSFKSDVSGPLNYLQSQAVDLLVCLGDIPRPPNLRNAISKMYMLYSLSQCLSACIYEALSDIDHLPKGVTLANASGFLLRKRLRTISAQEDTVSSMPSKWPGVQNLIALLSREKDEDAPSLRILLVDIFVAVYLSLFSFAMTAFDSRWLYRLAAHNLDHNMFAACFGGGGLKQMYPEGASRSPKPPRPPPPTASPFNQIATAVDPANLRAKFNAKVFGPPADAPSRKLSESSPYSVQQQSVCKWIPPRTGLIPYFMIKPKVELAEKQADYDSDESASDSDSESEDGEKPEHLNSDGYAWLLMRVALCKQIHFRLNQFLSVCGLDSNELASTAPLVFACLSMLDSWQTFLMNKLDTFPGGCPAHLLPDQLLAPTSTTDLPMHKYRCILEVNNTPFESDDMSARPVKRLWVYLVRHEYLRDIFIRYIFRNVREMELDNSTEGIASAGVESISEPIKVVQREQDPITAFAVSKVNPGWIVVSTGRELQEMDISATLNPSTHWMYDQAELDIALARIGKDHLKDNDDYLLVTGERNNATSTIISGRSTSFMTPFNIDRGRMALRKVHGRSKHKLEHLFGAAIPQIINLPYMCKRQVSGIRRMDSHANLPYYVTGANDGSVRVWEWGVPQPLYTPRQAGQYAKVTRVRFTNQGNKFGVTDNDGCLCLWQFSRGMNLRKPFFNFKVHTKSAADLLFIGGSSSLMTTAGYSTGDQNLAMWDTLLPANKALVHSWQCHPEGALCQAYMPNTQSLLTGGKHGEVCVWDLRQRQLRHSLKAFEHCSVKSMCVDPANEYFLTGSSDGDIKMWSAGAVPQLLYSLNGEHAGKSGFSLRNVGTGQVQGVQQLLIDSSRRLYSCGADCAFKMRTLPSLMHLL